MLDSPFHFFSLVIASCIILRARRSIKPPAVRARWM